MKSLARLAFPVAAWCAVFLLARGAFGQAPPPVPTPFGSSAYGPPPDGAAPAVPVAFDQAAPPTGLTEEEVRMIVAEMMNGREALVPVAPPADDEPEDPHEITAKWDHGLIFETRDENFRIHVGGRTQFDAAWFGVPSEVQADPTIANPWGDGVTLRRGVLRMDGKIYGNCEFAAEYDFFTSQRLGGTPTDVPVPTDLWWQINDLPAIGHLRFGNQKDAIGMEHLTSYRFLPLMERSFNHDAFYGGFNNGFSPGLSCFDTAWDENVTWNIGLYKPTNNPFGSSTNTDDYAVVGRVTTLLFYEDEGRRLLHFGLSAREASSFGGTVRYRTRGPERSGSGAVWPNPADTGTIFANEQLWLNAETAAVRGRWTLQGEYLVAQIDDAFRAVGDPRQSLLYHGGYGQVGFFLTDDHDNYNRATGFFDRIVPNENARRTGFLFPMFAGGAWQAIVRFNYLDLDDSGINGGTLHDVTGGLNWFLNPSMKLQGNYSITRRDGPTGVEGTIYGGGLRFAHDF